MEFNDNLRKLELSSLMEREDELTCDIKLYEEQLLGLQLSLQKKDIDVDEYQNDYDIISLKVTSLREKMRGISIEINNRIKDYDNYDEDIDSLGNEDFVDQYELHEQWDNFESKMRGGLYD